MFVGVGTYMATPTRAKTTWADKVSDLEIHQVNDQGWSMDPIPENTGAESTPLVSRF